MITCEEVYKRVTELTCQSTSLPAIGGGRVVAQVPKFNVVPVMIATWKGKDMIGVAGKMVNFAQYVQMQGGIVIYTGELERYLREKLSRKVSFQKVFKEWYSDRFWDKIHLDPTLIANKL